MSTEEKKHRIIVKYTVYGEHVRIRVFMGSLGEETAANCGSLMFRLDEFEAFREIMQKGLKEYRNAELEFREVDNVGVKEDQIPSS